MTKAIATNLRPIKAALQAVAEVDVLMAKAKLGKRMQGMSAWTVFQLIFSIHV
jgi:hypothetical protein